MAKWAAIGANVAVGIGWIVAMIRYIRALDELQQKIMLDALAITLGAGWVGGFGYVVADLAGLVPGELNAGVFPVFLAVVFIVAFIVGKIRYR